MCVCERERERERREREKRVGWIRCKCNQNLERNESDRRVSLVGKRYSIARSFAKDDDAYGLHRSGVDVCSNEPECVAFASSRNFTRGSTPREGTLSFFIILRKPFPVRADFGCKRTKDVAAKREHTHTDRQTI